MKMLGGVFIDDITFNLHPNT